MPTRAVRSIALRCIRLLAGLAVWSLAGYALYAAVVSTNDLVEVLGAFLAPAAIVVGGLLALAPRRLGTTQRSGASGESST